MPVGRAAGAVVEGDAMLDRVQRAITKLTLQARLRKALRGRNVSIISSNCIGGRLSQIAGEPYRSPTVGLWIGPDDFLKFAGGLPEYTKAELVHDTGESKRWGFPVGMLDDVRIMFMHYATFAEAYEKWNERTARLDPLKVLLVHTDRGANADHLSRFDALPYPKVLFVSKPPPELKSALWVRHGNEPDQVGDLTTHWHYLSPALSRSALRKICEELDRQALHHYFVKPRHLVRSALGHAGLVLKISDCVLWALLESRVGD